MKFKVGDRVAVYRGAHPDVSPARCEGSISRILANGILEVDFTKGFAGRWLCYPQQCRRLVKKERRRVWMRADCLWDSGFTRTRQPQEDIGSWIEFVEVKKK